MSERNTLELVTDLTVAALNASKSNTFYVGESSAKDVAAFIEIVYKKCESLKNGAQ